MMLQSWAHVGINLASGFGVTLFTIVLVMFVFEHGE